MPVKWDAEKDKFILNCLLLDPSVNIGTAVIDGIAKSWRKSSIRFTHMSLLFRPDLFLVLLLLLLLPRHHQTSLCQPQKKTKTIQDDPLRSL